MPVIKRYLDIFLILLLSFILVLLILFLPVDIFRIILGLPFVLFFPGYTLVAALFTSKEGMSGVERIALSFGMSLAVVPLLGLILNYTPWGIRLESILFSLTTFIIAMSIVVVVRRSRLYDDERYMFTPNIGFLKTLFGDAETEGELPSPAAKTVSSPVPLLPAISTRDVMVIIILLVLSISLVLLIAFIDSNTLSILLGIPFVLFLPGYALTNILFSLEDKFTLRERLAMWFLFSIGTGLVAIAMTGLVLTIMNNDITLHAVVLVLSTITAVLFMAALVVRIRGLARFHRLLSVEPKIASRSKIKWLDKALSALLIIAILAAVGTLIYAIAMPKVGEKFTEFYVLGTEGKAENYPKDIKLGDSAQVIVGIVNQEWAVTSYKVIINADNVTIAEVPFLVLDYKEKWEQPVAFKPVKAGDNQKVEFILYKEQEANPYLTLHLWVNVK